MCLRIRLLATLAWMILPGAGFAQNDDFKEDFDALKTDDSQGPFSPEVQFWDGQIIAAQPGERVPLYYRIDHLKAEKLVLPGIDRLVMLSYGDGKPVALGATNHEGVILQKEGNSFKPVPIPPSFGDFTIPRLIPSAAGIAVIDSLHFRRYQNGRWTAVAFPRNQGIWSEFSPGLQLKEYIVGSHLFGTIGNKFADFDLEKPNSGWHEALGSGAVVTALSVGVSEPSPTTVSGITLDAGGNLWVSEKGHSPKRRWRGLYRYNGKGWETIIRDPLDQDQSDARLSRSLGEMEFLDIFAAADGKLYVLEETGVFTYQEGTLNPVIKFNFGRNKETTGLDRNGKETKVLVSASPVGLAVDASGDVYVATQTFGILCFVRDGPSYHLKQVILPKAAE